MVRKTGCLSASGKSGGIPRAGSPACCGGGIGRLGNAAVMHGGRSLAGTRLSLLRALGERGRDDLASGQFSDDAVVIAGPDCTSLAPCVGKAAIRDRYIRSLRAGRTPLPLLDQRFNGESLRTHGESLPQQGPRGVVRVRGGHVFEFRNGLIQSLRVELDASDPATAAFIEGRKAAMPLAGH